MLLVDLLYIGLAAVVVVLTTGIMAYATGHTGRQLPRPACQPVRTPAMRSRRHHPR